MSRIKQAYLMWVGAKYYPKVEDICKEGIDLGWSRRVTGLPIAEALTQEGVVIFTAHDEGEYEDCGACEGRWVCEVCGGTGQIPKKAEPGKEPEFEPCGECEGSGSIRGSSGGTCNVDGKLWRYRRLLAMQKNPKLFKREEHDITNVNPCETCGGTGRIPKGKIFGVFIPQGIEYILKPGDDERLKEKLEKARVKMVPMSALEFEKRRGCGRRKPGGYYVVTEPGETSTKEAESVAAEMVKQGILDPEAIEVKGSFVRFLAPIPINGTKRFRGVKKWSLDPRAEEEAEMVLEAME